jgi:hypothetical protein
MRQKGEERPVNSTKKRRIGKRKLWGHVKPVRQTSVQEDLSSCLIAAELCPPPIPGPLPVVNLRLFSQPLTA